MVDAVYKEPSQRQLRVAQEVKKIIASALQKGDVEAARTGINRIKKRTEEQKHGHTCN